MSGGGEGAFNFSGDRGVHGGEDELWSVARLRVFDVVVVVVFWCGAALVSFCGFRLFLAGRAFARSQPREVEQRMPVEKLDEMLAHHAGSAEDAHFDSAHKFSSCLTIL